METISGREAMLELTTRLIREHEDVPPGSVLRCVARCRTRLSRAGVRQGLVDATEAMARQRLGPSA